MRAVRERDLAALAQHDVVVELTGEPFVKPERALEKPGAREVVVVRAHDLGVTPGVALADRAALEHGDVLRCRGPWRGSRRWRARGRRRR